MKASGQINIQPPDLQPGQEALTKRVEGHVMEALGPVTQFLSLQVRPLWDSAYRVNVMVGDHAAAARVAHSFFVIVDSAGTILEARPKLRRATVMSAAQKLPNS